MGALSSGNVRVSLHRGTTDDEVTRFLDVLPAAIATVRAELGATDL
jgi:cysteine desulfurase